MNDQTKVNWKREKHCTTISIGTLYIYIYTHMSVNHEYHHLVYVLHNMYVHMYTGWFFLLQNIWYFSVKLFCTYHALKKMIKILYFDSDEA